MEIASAKTGTATRNGMNSPMIAGASDNPTGRRMRTGAIATARRGETAATASNSGRQKFASSRPLLPRRRQ